MEGVLVRHPPSSLTRRRGERGPGGAAAWSWSLDVATRGGSGQRRRLATEGARGHVTSSVRGRKSRGREAQRGGATDRSSTRTARRPFPTRAPELRLRTHGGTGRGRWPKLEGRRQATLHPGRVRWRSNDRRRAGAGRRGRPKGRKLPRACPEGAKALEGGPARDCRGVPQGSPRARARKGSGKGEQVRSGIGWSVLGARGRKSVAEVGEKHLSPRTLGVPRGAHALRGGTGKHGDSLKRPVGL